MEGETLTPETINIAAAVTHEHGIGALNSLQMLLALALDLEDLRINTRFSMTDRHEQEAAIRRTDPTTSAESARGGPNTEHGEVVEELKRVMDWAHGLARDMGLEYEGDPLAVLDSYTRGKSVATVEVQDWRRWGQGHAPNEDTSEGIRKRIDEKCDGTMSQADLEKWREWAFAIVGPRRRCEDLRELLDERLAAAMLEGYGFSRRGKGVFVRWTKNAALLPFYVEAAHTFEPKHTYQEEDRPAFEYAQHILRQHTQATKTDPQGRGAR